MSHLTIDVNEDFSSQLLVLEKDLYMAVNMEKDCLRVGGHFVITPEGYCPRHFFSPTDPPCPLIASSFLSSSSFSSLCSSSSSSPLSSTPCSVSYLSPCSITQQIRSPVSTSYCNYVSDMSIHLLPMSNTEDYEGNHNMSESIRDHSLIRSLDEVEQGCVLFHSVSCSGQVIEGLHRNSGTKLVIKVIHINQEDLSSQKRCRYLSSELRTLHNCDHPHIIKFYNAFFRNGSVYLLLEHMDRYSISDLLKRKELSHQELLNEAVVAWIVRQILLALQYLHNIQNTVHRDIKAGNILINSKGCVKLADFGVSALPEEIINGEFAGTTFYMSPERFSGDVYGFASDIWSLGMMIYHLVTKNTTFSTFPGTSFVRSVSSPMFPVSITVPPVASVCNTSRSNEPMSFWDIQHRITKLPAPRLSSEQHYSPELVSFVNQCLVEDPLQRSDVNSLLVHSFLQKYCNMGSLTADQSNLAQWVEGPKICPADDVVMQNITPFMCDSDCVDQSTQFKPVSLKRHRDCMDNSDAELPPAQHIKRCS